MLGKKKSQSYLWVYEISAVFQGTPGTVFSPVQCWEGGQYHLCKKGHVICKSANQPPLLLQFHSPMSSFSSVFDMGWVAALILNVILMLSYIPMYNFNNKLLHLFIQLMETIVCLTQRVFWNLKFAS